MAELKAPKAIIFDWDNTLVNTWPMIHSALHQTFTHYGLEPWTLAQTKERVAHSMRDAFPKLFGDKWEEAGKHFQSAYQRDHLTQLEVLEQAEELLQFLTEKDVYLAVVSNKKGHNLRAEAKHLGWDKYFGHLVGSDDAANDKPHRDPVDMALEGSGLKAGDEVWFVGDTAIDLECAKNTGCVPILYGDAVATEQNGRLQLGGFFVDYHAESHNNFISTLKRLL